MLWTRFIKVGTGNRRFCEHGKEHSGPKQCGECLDRMVYPDILKDTAPCSYVPFIRRSFQSGCFQNSAYGLVTLLTV